MDVKREFLTACQLLGLLYLFVWSLTWNLPGNYDFFRTNKHSPTEGENLKTTTQQHTKFLVSNDEKHSKSIHSAASINQDEKWATDSVNTMLPSFNIWKELELTKHDRKELQGKQQVPINGKPLKRKLNYSSSKCGAKVLAANKEAKYRKAILNEKFDEYMLNPCKAKVWFIIELCDNIEATQVEIANYELYSSTPKEFTVFWSDVFPTQTWHPLGKFEAKDQRSVQIFELKTRNMGKFIKVNILNHHGKEHYCPLSVFRILGYSMLYEYENLEIEHEKSASNVEEDSAEESYEETEKLRMKRNSTQQAYLLKKSNENNHNYSIINSFTASFCETYKKYCKFSKHTRKTHNCLHKHSCLFLKVLTGQNRNIHTCSNICRKKFVKNSNFSERKKPKSFFLSNDNSNLIEHFKIVNSKTIAENYQRNNKFSFVLSSSFRDKEHLAFLYWPNVHSFKKRTPIKSVLVEEKRLGKDTEDNTLGKSDNRKQSMEFNDEVRTMNLEKLQKNKRIKQNADVSDNTKACCECRGDHKVSNMAQESVTRFEFNPADFLEQETSIESAALIQKESVLIKLTARMKASETNLNLINRYLQKLSQSYNQQMDEMQILFNATFNAMHVASKENNKINELQQIIIENLQQQIQTLSYQAQYLSQAQENTFKKVFELHAFFLVLEFIIMSTLFSIFVNRYRLNK